MHARRLRALRRRALPRQESVALALHPARPRRAQGDRRRIRRARSSWSIRAAPRPPSWRTSTCGAARHRRLAARRAPRRPRAGGPRRRALARARTPTGVDEVLARARARSRRRVLRARRGRRGRSCAAPRARIAARAGVAELRGPRRADEPALDARQLPPQLLMAPDRQLRQSAAARNLPLPSSPSTVVDGGGGGGSAHARSPARGSSRGLVPVQRDRRGDPHRPPEALPRDDRRGGEPRALARRRQRMREALARARLLVVIDVAMTETARLADYVLPASSQFEKAEATFFNFEFPRNYFHLRPPLLRRRRARSAGARDPRAPLEALGALTDDDLAPLREAAREGRAAFAAAFVAATSANPRLAELAPVILYRTLGPTLPDGAAPRARSSGRCASAAPCVTPRPCARAGFDGEPLEPGEALFDAILDEPVRAWSSPSTTSTTTVAAHATPRRKVNLRCRICSASSAVLGAAPPRRRRSGLPVRALRGRAPLVHRQHDHPRPGVAQEGRRRRAAHEPGGRRAPRRRRRRRASASRRGAAASTVAVEISDTMQPGHVSLPNGLGLGYPDASAGDRRHRRARRTSSPRARIATRSRGRRGTSTCPHAWRP